MATSGTVSGVVYPNVKLLDHSFRRAGYTPQKVTAEAIQIALELLFSITAALVSSSFPLWTRRYVLLGVVKGSAEVPTPTGTVDVLNAYWRAFQPYRGSATLSSSVSDTSLFSGASSADVVIAGPDPSVTVNYGTPTEVDTIGVLLGGSASITAALDVYTSNGGATWTKSQSLPSATYAPGVWTYFDLNPTIVAQYVKLQYTGGASWTLNQLNFCIANGNDVPLGVLNIDDYFNLPNKLMRGDRPNSYFDDRAIQGPVIRAWPVPNDAAFYNGTVTALIRRYIQDPGTMKDELEIPPRWIEAIQWRLAERIMMEIPEEMVTGQADQQMTYLKMQQRQTRLATCTASADKEEAKAWGEERTRGPIRLMPDLSCYTK